MPKATLEFNLPEERGEFHTAVNANKYIAALQDIDTELRNKIKYAGDDVSDDTHKAYQEIRDKLGEMCEGFDLWEQL